jgi:putative endonuclease
VFGLDRDRKTTGRAGERLAARFLKKRGCKILRRNCRAKFGEIDLLVRDGDEVVFVEVKTLASRKHGAPDVNLRPDQVRRIRLAAERLATRARITHHPLRFDVVTVVLSQQDEPEIRHYENAFSIREE